MRIQMKTKEGPMTSRERVLAACHHKTPDRVPCDTWFRDDVREKFQAWLGIKTEEELNKFIGSDLRTIGCKWNNPEYNAKCNGVLGDHVELTGGRFIFHENGVFEDMWGVLQKNGKSGLYTEWVGGPFVDAEDAEELDDFNWPKMEYIESQESVNKRVQALRDLGDFAIQGSVSNPYKTSWQVRGMENILCDMLINEDMAIGLMERFGAYYKEMGCRLVRAGVDIMRIVGDIATQNSLLFSIDVYKRIMKPVLQDMIHAFKEINPDLLMFFHSDGCLDMVMDELIDTGFDIINPIQPECMDVFAVKDKYGDKITMHGTVSIQELLPFGSVEDVHREVRKIIDYCGRDGGLIICPANLIQNDTPMENILALYEEVNGHPLR